MSAAGSIDAGNVAVPPGLVVDRLVDAAESVDLGTGELDDCRRCRGQEYALMLFARGLAVLDVAAVEAIARGRVG